MSMIKTALTVLLAVSALHGCTTFSTSTASTTSSAMPSNISGNTLKSVYHNKFLVGATVNNAMLNAEYNPSLETVKEHFSAITTDNALKWEAMNPTPDKYHLEVVDRFVKFGQRHNIQLVGHVLFWHSQTPDWVFEDTQGQLLTREALLKRMRERAQLLAERYGDSIKIWDVVNEAINDDGTLRESKYHRIIGPDFIEQAFIIAAEEFPADTKLLYNDYGMDRAGRKTTVIAMLNDFKKRGIKIDGVGVQGHWSMNQPSLQTIDESLAAYAATGVPIHITELDLDYLGREHFFSADVDIEKIVATPENNPYSDGNFPASADAELAQRYKDIFGLFLKHSDNIERVTFWGVNDSDSWLNGWPVKGRTNYPLLFDRNNAAKPAVDVLLQLNTIE
ncbi:endo-1,4-beta-xylanase [Marinagarivorans algicola]|uniref:endo-1,4-beta-xylanase n=1 Tax=Marinagarivorans algicola TaxID=1513270 RepID=UPI0037356825